MSSRPSTRLRPVLTSKWRSVEEESCLASGDASPRGSFIAPGFCLSTIVRIRSALGTIIKFIRFGTLGRALFTQSAELITSMHYADKPKTPERAKLPELKIEALPLTIFVANQNYRANGEKVGRILSAHSPVCTFTRPPLRCRSCALRLCVQNSRTAPFGFRTPPPSQAPGPFPKNFCPWQRGDAATWEQRTFAPFGMCPD